MKSKSRPLRRGASRIGQSKKTVPDEPKLNSIPSLLLPTPSPGWSKSNTTDRSKAQARSRLALKLARLLAESKQGSKANVAHPTMQEFERLFGYAFGKGRVDAQLIAAFFLQYQDLPAVRKHLDKLVGSATARGDADFLRDLAKALAEQKQSPRGRDRWRAAMMARRIEGKPGMTVSSLGKKIDQGARNRRERASADQNARRVLNDTGMFLPDKRGFKTGAKRTPRDKR